MQEILYFYDGSFEGFLSCVFESYAHHECPSAIESEEVPTLFASRWVETEVPHAQRVLRKLHAVSPWGLELVRRGFLTCLPQRERTMFDLIYLAFHQALPQDLTDDRVLLLTRAIQHLTHEAHQLKGFVRFADYGGVLVGQIAPKNRVLPLLRPHFCQRLPEEAFLLHDKTHREGLFYADRKWKIRPVDHLDLDRPDQAELQCQALWRRFYQTIAIPARHNPKCRMSHMPKRYWDNLPEMQPDPMSTPQ